MQYFLKFLIILYYIVVLNFSENTLTTKWLGHEYFIFYCGSGEVYIILNATKKSLVLYTLILKHNILQELVHSHVGCQI